MSIPGSVHPLLLGAAGQETGETGGYEIERSLRFNSSDSAYLSRTPSVAGNRKTWTWAGWVKRSKLGTNQALIHCRISANTNDTSIAFTTSDTLRFVTGVTNAVNTNAVFRDTSAWYHITCAFDTTQATAANRIKLYVNGVEQTFASTSYPSQNSDWSINSTSAHNIGAYNINVFYGDFYLAESYLIDGQALDPTSFGEFDTNGIWQPKAYTGTYGTNGFHLPFSDNSTAAALGTDTSGNSNTWTVNNISVAAGAGNDSLVDTPSSTGTDTGAGGEVRGNYATLNPLLKATSTTLSNGNLDFVAATSAGVYESAICTVGVSSGKWYAEFLVVTQGNDSIAGVTSAPYNIVNGWPGGYANSIGYEAVLGGFYKDGVAGQVVNTYAANDIVGVALDLDNAAIWFSKNGTWQGTGSPNPATNTSPAYSSLTAGTYFFAAGTGGSGKIAANFGQRPFAYTAPSGFKALCTTNLPDPVVAQPSTVMDVLLWTGTGTGADRTISGLNFTNTPGLIWGKGRSSAYHHTLWDVVRGYGQTNVLSSDRTEGQGWTASGRIKSANSSSITWEADSGSLWYDGSSTTYVAWTWDAGSSTVTNTDGSITSTVRANQTAGFSIVTFTAQSSGNATIGHGLGVDPTFIIVKSRAAAYDWVTYHVSNGNTKAIRFTTEAANTSSWWWNNTSPTSTVFTLGSSYAGAGNSVAYCFAPVAGYTASFSYTGNGSTDGVFQYLGFRPRLILLKCSSTTGNWTLLDTAREGYNVDNDPLYPNLSNAEGTTDLLDITSNGFKLRTTDASVNSSGATYIGYAWAESPFQYSRAR